MSDWDTVTILRKKAPKGSQTSQSAINVARRTGAEVSTEQKCKMSKFFIFFLNLFLFFFSKKFNNQDDGGKNKQHIVTKNTAKLDRETEELRHSTVSLDVGKLIQKGRLAKGFSQKDLATVSFLCKNKKIFLEVLILSGPRSNLGQPNIFFLFLKLFKDMHCFLRDVLLLFTVCLPKILLSTFLQC